MALSPEMWTQIYGKWAVGPDGNIHRWTESLGVPEPSFEESVKNYKAKEAWEATLPRSSDFGQSLGGAIMGAGESVGNALSPGMEKIGSQVAEPVMRNVVEAAPYLGAAYFAGQGFGLWGGGAGAGAGTGTGTAVLPAGGMAATGPGMGELGVIGGGATGAGGGAVGTGMTEGYLEASALPAGGMAATGTLSPAEASMMGVGAAGTSSGSGSLMSTIAGPGGSNIAPLMGLAGSLYSGGQAGKTGQAAAAAADPFASQRGQYQALLSQLINNPDSITKNPIFQLEFDMGLEGVNRSAGAKHLLGSGNRLAALTDYASGVTSDQFYKYANLLSTLSGATTGSPAAAGQALSSAGTNQAAANAGAISATSQLLTNAYNNWNK